MTDPITFVIPGERQATRGAARVGRSSALPGDALASVRLSARRDGTEAVRVQARPGQDVVVLHLAGGPALVLHPENARDLLRGQGTATRGAAAAEAQGEVSVGAQLRWHALEQAAPTRSGGFLGGALLTAFEVFGGPTIDAAADFATSAAVRHLDGQVEAGVYALRREALGALKGSGQRLAQVPAPADAQREPLLVLIHGTFVDTVSTFGKLWELHPEQVAELFAHYGGRVYALDHPTLGASPLANALTLVQALPAGARLHLATHSRGGLVAEVLARVCAAAPASAQPTAHDLAHFSAPAYAAQRGELHALWGAVRARGTVVERVLRVACPARGTLLASKRLDAYLSVLKWTLELTGVPALPVLVDLLAEVAQRRADPAVLPGLAAMMPGAPVLEWLNDAAQAIPGDLRVVAGDLQGDSLGSWLKTLLTDAFYWTDNDIVVQTLSMYGGAPRKAGASFLLDQGGKTTHFNYFVNERTVQAVVAGLVQAQPAGFAVIGPLSWRGDDASGARAALRDASDAHAAAAKPAVIVLPGILGSHLKVGGERIWLAPRLIGGLDKLRWRSGVDDGVAPDGPIGSVYDDLCDHLATSHEVIEFAFDWRRPIEDEARRLAATVEQALDARNASGQPVRLLAHSMGGLVARTMQLECPATWARLMQRSGARLVMLGTPNGGSWAPMQVLSGDDTFGNALAVLGSPLHERRARQWMAEMPGFIQLQAALTDPKRDPGRDPALALERSETWRRLADEDLKRVQDANWWHRASGEAEQAAYAWGVPPQGVLDQACALRARLDAQRGQLAPWAEQMLLVVGQAPFTPDGFEVGAGGFVYLDAAGGGDGRVTQASALLPGVRTWSLNCEHGSLPSHEAAFAAYAELLERGDTDRLTRLPQPRGAGAAAATATSSSPAARVRSRPSRSGGRSAPPASTRDVFALPRAAEAAPATSAASALRVRVLNGNLSFVRQCLMLGHMSALSLTGTEAVVNRLLGGALQTALDAGLYPDAPGTHQLFADVHAHGDARRHEQPACAVVVGLGPEGKLTEQELARTVRQGVIAWSQRMNEEAAAPAAEMDLAATLMGSGGVGMNASTAARAIAQGVRDANLRLAGSGWPCVGQLTLVELYLERASDAWHGLQVLAEAAPGRYAVAPTIASGVGPLRRTIDSGYRGADYDFIRATSPGADAIEFTLDTRRARTEVRAQSTQGRLLRELVARASTDSNADARLGHTLFQLLVPPEVEPFLAGTSRMLLELDDATAAIPWELLDTRGSDDGSNARSDDRPWAIRSRLLRKLRQETYRQQVQDAGADDAVLVIGEPRADASRYAPLPGARAEALAVAAAFAAAQAPRVSALVAGEDATSVMNALFERPYRIVHVAGHGEPVRVGDDGQVQSKGGVVLSDATFLGPDEIACMRTVPELVFVNCCHLGALEPGSALRGAAAFNRAAFAWGVADALIAIGVRCVVAAGWAVDDKAAEVFASTFYRALLSRQPFVEAVAQAREAAWLEDKGGNTWAAYQCYGDPNWVLHHDAEAGRAAARRPLSEEFSGIASPLGLALALEEIAVKSRWMGAAAAVQRERVRHLEARFGALWGGMGAVAEAFGLACAEAGDAHAAIGWYERALRCVDASASLRTQEQLGKLRARCGWARVRLGTPTADELTQARSEITAGLRELQALAGLQPTPVRLSLCGSAWKRLAMLERRCGDARAMQAALEMAAQAYRSAETLAREQARSDAYRPALNRMALDLVRHTGRGGWSGFSAADAAWARSSLQAKAQDAPDFWSHAGLIEIDAYEAIAAARMAQQVGALLHAWAQLRERATSPGVWASRADQAQLVFGAYAAVARDAERDAAHALLAALQGYAAA